MQGLIGPSLEIEPILRIEETFDALMEAANKHGEINAITTTSLVMVMEEAEPPMLMETLPCH